MAMTFARPHLMRWGANEITDHNRSPLAIDIERIEKKSRMANGSLRKYWVADKRTFSCSWTMLPNKSVATVDGNWGGEDMENFYFTHPGQFVLELSTGQGEKEFYNVMLSEFSKSVVKRGPIDFWEVSVTMEEV